MNTDQVEQKYKFVVMRSFMRALVEGSTIIELDEKIAENDDMRNERYKFWKQVALYALYCAQEKTAGKVITMLVTVFPVCVQQDFGSGDERDLMDKMKSSLIGKFEADLSEG